MHAIKLKITEFIDDWLPGWVECKFTDAWGKEHTIHEKVPIVTKDDLDAKSNYPREGLVAFEFVRKWNDEKGRTIFSVSTARPWGVETIEGLLQFDILEDQVIEFDHSN